MNCFYVALVGAASGLSFFTARAQEQGLAAAPPADSVWYDAGLAHRHVSSQTDSAGTCAEVLSWGDATGLVRVFYPSGHLKEYVPYGDFVTGRRHGLTTTWFENGQLQTRQVFENGQRTGTLSVYYETGALKRQVDYVAGVEQLGACYDPEGRPLAYYPYEQLPLYPGGQAQLTKEITKALRLPRRLPLEAYLGPLQMEVLLQIAEDGSIQTPRVARSSRLTVFDQAVLTAIARLSRRFTPGQRDGQRVACAYYLPIRLTLPPPFAGVPR
jgi:protein TonB